MRCQTGLGKLVWLQGTGFTGRGRVDSEGGGSFNPRIKPTESSRALAPEGTFREIRSLLSLSRTMHNISPRPIGPAAIHPRALAPPAPVDWEGDENRAQTGMGRLAHRAGNRPHPHRLRNAGRAHAALADRKSTRLNSS